MMHAAIAPTEYQQTLDYLYTRLPMFSRIGAAALKPDLTNTIALCAALDNPQQKFKSVHIAGTNGKGSTSHMLAAIFQEAGYKTGLYTSPHLVDFRERIRINGVPVSEEFVNRFVAGQKQVIESVEPSFFEITVAMAFAAFAEAAVDIAVIETGLGGRLDSTNVITPELSIITNISFDHTDLLGNTITEIAREKAGIIKQGVPVVIGQYDEASLEVFQKIATEKHAPLYIAWRGFGQIRGYGPASSYTRQAMEFNRSHDNTYFRFQSDMLGDFQHKNIRTVFAAVSILADNGWKVPVEIVRKALFHVKELTGLRGRFDVLQRHPLIIGDVAHNAAGIGAIMHNWNIIKAWKKHIILGFVRDKDVRSALALFPKDNIYHFCAAKTPRALPAEELAAIAAEMNLSGTVHPSVEDAVLTTRGLLRDHHVHLLITGSFYIVGEAMQALGISP